MRNLRAEAFLTAATWMVNGQIQLSGSGEELLGDREVRGRRIWAGCDLI